MLQVTNNQIRLTCGDTCSLQITIYTQLADEDNESEIPIEEQIYQLQEGDILKFVVLDINKEGLSNKRFLDAYNAYVNKTYSRPPVIEKDFTDNVVVLQSLDTKFLNPGCYLYGCVLIKKDGEINTIQSGDFILTQGFY